MSLSIIETKSTCTSPPPGEEASETNATQRSRYAHARDMPECLRNAPRCHARTHSGRSCRSPAVKGKRVCRMHGARAGAPKGKANGSYRHGGFTVEAIDLRREVSALLRAVRKGTLNA